MKKKSQLVLPVMHIACAMLAVAVPLYFWLSDFSSLSEVSFWILTLFSVISFVVMIVRIIALTEVYVLDNGTLYINSIRTSRRYNLADCSRIEVWKYQKRYRISLRIDDDILKLRCGQAFFAAFASTVKSGSLERCDVLGSTPLPESDWYSPAGRRSR